MREKKRELKVKQRRKKKGKLREKDEPSTLLHCYLNECGQGLAPLAETKWLAGIWCNLHLSAKSWILFLWSRCWRAWRKAQLTGPHSWEWCVWPTYRGSSSQLRATTLMENGETRLHDLKIVSLSSLHAEGVERSPLKLSASLIFYFFSYHCSLTCPYNCRNTVIGASKFFHFVLLFACTFGNPGI